MARRGACPAPARAPPLPPALASPTCRRSPCTGPTHSLLPPTSAISRLEDAAVDGRRSSWASHLDSLLGLPAAQVGEVALVQTNCGADDTDGGKGTDSEPKTGEKSTSDRKKPRWRHGGTHRWAPCQFYRQHAINREISVREYLQPQKRW
ncbi:hypothetical protein BRADI_4g16428v3 [Brachypodium distachyon]|uniref:Uncharacterized protein n=1 Tax=Brachypodium distachyon TaxID=15368 RepID=A0A2K2CN80_BRADI|nr:hypothetical protein BRADI_4g16428v3 [Brachypodium distachyon]